MSGHVDGLEGVRGRCGLKGSWSESQMGWSVVRSSGNVLTETTLHESSAIHIACDVVCPASCLIFVEADKRIARAAWDVRL